MKTSALAGSLYLGGSFPGTIDRQGEYSCGAYQYLDLLVISGGSWLEYPGSILVSWRGDLRLLPRAKIVVEMAITRDGPSGLRFHL